MRTRIPVVVAAALLAATAASAQVQQRPLGIGVTVNPWALFVMEEDDLGYMPWGFGDFYLPINAGPGVRIEPEAGVWRMSMESSTPTSRSSSSGTQLRLGVGLLLLKPLGGGTQFYAGPRAGIIRTSSRYQYSGPYVPATDQKSHQTDKWIALAVGGEHFFSPHFSLGAEAQLKYISYGEEVVDSGTSPPPDADYSRSALSNTGLIFLRYYF